MHEVRGHCGRITNGMQTIPLLALDRVVVTANTLHYAGTARVLQPNNIIQSSHARLSPGDS
jgi:hypothetical protein